MRLDCVWATRSLLSVTCSYPAGPSGSCLIFLVSLSAAATRGGERSERHRWGRAIEDTHRQREPPNPEQVLKSSSSRESARTPHLVSG